MHHVLAAKQFNPEELGEIFEQTDQFKEMCHTDEGRRESAQMHVGQQICSAFYEPSTRTKASFELAAAKLGMGLFETESAGEFSSIAKGETIEDTVRVLGSYGVAAIVLRLSTAATGRVNTRLSRFWMYIRFMRLWVDWMA
jgi:aspartate carbamoyltransferase catalytic subunit